MSRGESEIDKAELAKVRFNVPRTSAVNNGETSFVNTFQFNRVLGMGVKQDEVFDVVARDSVMSAMEGKNANNICVRANGFGKDIYNYGWC